MFRYNPFNEACCTGVPVWGVFIDGFIWVCHQGRVHWNANLDLISVSRVCLGCGGVCVCNGADVYIELTLILLISFFFLNSLQSRCFFIASQHHLISKVSVIQFREIINNKQ